MIAEFTRGVGEMLRDLGAKPFFSVMDWDIIQDAYIGGGIVLDALNAVGAVNYCGCARAMLPGASFETSDLMGRQQKWIWHHMGSQRGEWGNPPSWTRFDTLELYFRSGHFWSSPGRCWPVADMAEGFLSNIHLLASYGFEAASSHVGHNEMVLLDEMHGGNTWREVYAPLDVKHGTKEDK
jgi:hypothetical protein